MNLRLALVYAVVSLVGKFRSTSIKLRNGFSRLRSKLIRLVLIVVGIFFLIFPRPLFDRGLKLASANPMAVLYLAGRVQ